jgi:hypothetical protein
MNIDLYMRVGAHPNGLYLKMATITGLAAKTLAPTPPIVFRASQCFAKISGAPLGANPRIYAFGFDD